ncbi:hypothetical protein MC7420_7068 [Coleofasciculus chthonoplastes PCC 7420]|uniref:Uncharacterized protein n=1 Tax=Coleofasciculus chthonoplastes PCC 7420 TaxID=118168 RepID=B4VI43_9CYAN|nr:hypothetical protein MC7420_7068 [Coleofasciculus chthonoplastes PCC 7420]
MAKWGEDAHSAQKSSPRRSHCCYWELKEQFLIHEYGKLL